MHEGYMYVFTAQKEVFLPIPYASDFGNDIQPCLYLIPKTWSGIRQSPPCASYASAHGESDSSEGKEWAEACLLKWKMREVTTVSLFSQKKNFKFMKILKWNNEKCV